MKDIPQAIILQGIQNFKLTDVALLVLLDYDWLLTFLDELEIVWTRPFTLPKLFFFLARYLAIATQLLQVHFGFDSQPDVSDCGHMADAIVPLSVLIFIFTESLMLLRTSAFYRGNKKVFFVIYSFYTSCCVAGVIAITVWTQNVHSTLLHHMGPIIGPSCGLQDSNDAVIVCIVGVLLGWELVITVLAFFSSWFEVRQLHRLHPVTMGPYTFKSLFQHLWNRGFIFYLCTVFVTLINLGLLIQDDESVFPGLLLSTERAAHSLAATNLILFTRSRSKNSRDSNDYADSITEVGHHDPDSKDTVELEERPNVRLSISDLEHQSHHSTSRMLDRLTLSVIPPIINVLPPSPTASHN